jgi:hypothetical protein
MHWILMELWPQEGTEFGPRIIEAKGTRSGRRRETLALLHKLIICHDLIRAADVRDLHAPPQSALTYVTSP